MQRLAGIIFSLISGLILVELSALRVTAPLDRRGYLCQTAGLVSSSLLVDPAAAQPRLSYDYFSAPTTRKESGQVAFPAITPPFFHRATHHYELGQEAWAFEHLLAFANVTATIRSNVIKLRSTGGLWVHSPVYPTNELVSLLQDLNAPVEHIVLPCNAFEHKAPIEANTQSLNSPPAEFSR